MGMRRKYTDLERKEREKLSKQRYKELNKHKAHEYIYKNYEWYLWNSAKSRARKYNMLFDIRKEDIVIPLTCPYLGIPLTRIQGAGRQDSNPSIDRIDSNKGYTRDNIEVISDLANRMKNNASPEQLKAFAKSILLKYEH